MIATWLSLAAGWALTHAWSAVLLITVLVVAAIWLVIVPLIDAPEGAHRKPPAWRRALTRTSRATNPPRWRAGMTRAARRLEAVRRLPGAIIKASRPGDPRRVREAPGLSAAAGRPVRARPGTKTLGPGARHPFGPVTTAACSGASSLKVDSPVPELHHEPTERAMLAWLAALRGPGWTVLALRRQMAVLGALIASGRVTPGHTAPTTPAVAEVHGEPGHPAGDDIRRDIRETAQTLALTEYLAAPPPPHDPALWQPRPAEQTDWSLLAVLAPGLAAERLDAQQQAGA